MSRLSLPFEVKLFFLLGLGLSAMTLGVTWDYSNQIIFLAIMISCFGLPHGALDGLVARQAGLWEGQGGFITFHMAYLALAGLAIASWMMVPVFSLIVFLAISGWHFGSDWHGSLSPLQRLSAGLAIVTVPSVLHTEAVTSIYQTLSGPNAEVIALAQSQIGIILLLITLAVALLKTRSEPNTSIELFTVLALSLILEPLYFFVAYFCGLHSPRHLVETWRACAVFGRRTVTFWLILNTSVALLIALAVFVVFRDSGVESSVLTRLVFIGIAALTVPHMLLIEWSHPRTVSA